jgi:hypothetical protein
MIYTQRLIDKLKKDLNEKESQVYGTIKRIIHTYISPKYKIGDKIEYRFESYDCIKNGRGLITDILIDGGQYGSYEYYYEIYSYSQNKKIKVADANLTLTPPSQSHQAHSNPVQPPA